MGVGKSSLINILFAVDCVEVNVLFSIDEIKNYQWQVEMGEVFNFWDIFGYEQVKWLDL